MRGILQGFGATRTFGVILEFSEMHHLPAPKVAGGMLGHPLFLGGGQVCKSLTYQFPINIKNVACCHMTPGLPVGFGDRFHDGLIKGLLGQTAVFVLLEGDRP